MDRKRLPHVSISSHLGTSSTISNTMAAVEAHRFRPHGPGPVVPGIKFVQDHLARTAVVLAPVPRTSMRNPPLRSRRMPGDLTPMTEKISATIEIAAAPKQVWAVLADLASYPEWNPVFREVSGQLAPGNRITIKSTQPETGHTMTVKVKVLTAEPATELRWVSSVVGLMTGEHSFILSPTSGGTQLVQTHT